jgi:plasmid maintenance system antidote protein VapI
MKNRIQSKLAKQIGKSEALVSLIVNGKRRPSWQTAKKLAKTTGTRPELWLDGSPEKIRTVLEAVDF